MFSALHNHLGEPEAQVPVLAQPLTVWFQARLSFSSSSWVITSSPNLWVSSGPICKMMFSLVPFNFILVLPHF